LPIISDISVKKNKFWFQCQRHYEPGDLHSLSTFLQSKWSTPKSLPSTKIWSQKSSPSIACVIWGRGQFQEIHQSAPGDGENEPDKHWKQPVAPVSRKGDQHTQICGNYIRQSTDTDNFKLKGGVTQLLSLSSQVFIISL
jgi:hypothetical protein